MTLLNDLAGKYTYWFKCTNCETVQDIGIPKGTTVKEFLDGNYARFKYCRCNTLVTDTVTQGVPEVRDMLYSHTKTLKKNGKSKR